MTGMHVLVVDDEPAIVEIVRDYLADAGYRVSTASTGGEAVRQVRAITPDLVVLDLGLPDIDGLDVARTVRETAPVPIIMLTARSDEADRVVGLELGADDYLVKPFSPRELLARVRAVLRRSAAAATDVERPVTVGELIIDPARRTVTVAGRAVDLTATEFDLLARLAASPGRVFTRNQLLEVIHGVAVDAGARGDRRPREEPAPQGRERPPPAAPHPHRPRRRLPPGRPVSERVFERANNRCGAKRSLVHRPSSVSNAHGNVVHQ